MKCTRCGTMNSPSAKFCKQCAATLTAAQPQATLTCPKCGAQNALNAKFCQECATPLSVANPPTPQNVSGGPDGRQSRALTFVVIALIVLLCLVGAGVVVLLTSQGAVTISFGGATMTPNPTVPLLPTATSAPIVQVDAVLPPTATSAPTLAPTETPMPTSTSTLTPMPTDTATPTPTPTRLFIPSGVVFLPSGADQDPTQGGPAPPPQEVAVADGLAQAVCDANPGQCIVDPPKLQNPMPPGALRQNRFEIEWEDSLTLEQKNAGLNYNVVLCKDVNGFCIGSHWSTFGTFKGCDRGKCTIGVDAGWQQPGVGKIWVTIRIVDKDGNIVSRPGTVSSFIIVPKENTGDQFVAPPPSSGY